MVRASKDMQVRQHGGRCCKRVCVDLPCMNKNLFYSIKQSCIHLRKQLATSRNQRGRGHSLVVHYGWSVSRHGLLFYDVDELKGAADWSIGVGPFRALEVTHFQHIIILRQKAACYTLTHTHPCRCKKTHAHTCMHTPM